jgi:hypothetical protein
MSGWRREGCRITASPDLNTLFPASANLFATITNKINKRGQISGMAIARSGPDTGNLHAFLATLHTKAWASRLQTSHLHARNPICPRMLANSFCGDSDSQFRR